MFKNFLEKCYEWFSSFVVCHGIKPNSIIYRIIANTLDTLYEKVNKDI